MKLHLSKAMKDKNDEFYTLIDDVASEMGAYLAVNPDLFRGKTILLPCDAEWSAFTQYFTAMSDSLGIKRVINSSIDFRLPEVRALRDEADFRITNPPFSLMREFMAWVIESGKGFSFVAPQIALSYNGTWPLLRDRLLWWGARQKHMKFRSPEGDLKSPNQCGFFTNLPHNNPPQPLPLLPTETILRDNRYMQGLTEFQRYSNCDAIDVPRLTCIPSDYDGLMGVPITIYKHHCPEQFQLVRSRYGDDGEFLRIGDRIPFARILIRRIG